MSIYNPLIPAITVKSLMFKAGFPLGEFVHVTRSEHKNLAI